MTAPRQETSKMFTFEFRRSSTSTAIAATRKDVQASGATGPRDHTSISLGGFYYYGRNASQYGPDRFSRGSAPFMSRSIGSVGICVSNFGDNFEIYGLLMYGRDQNLIPDTTYGIPAAWLAGDLLPEDLSKRSIGSIRG